MVYPEQHEAISLCQQAKQQVERLIVRLPASSENEHLASAAYTSLGRAIDALESITRFGESVPRDDTNALPMPAASKRFVHRHGLKAVDELPDEAFKLTSEITNPGVQRKGFVNRDVSVGFSDHSAIKDSRAELTRLLV